MLRGLGLLAAAVLLGAGFAGAQDKPADVTLKLVKYAGLTDLVRHNRGKVVLVDFWNFPCIPCKREMPNLVELQKEFAAEGLVAITVALDDPPDQSAQEDSLRFLKSIRSNTINLMLDESPDYWGPKLNIAGVPHVILFDRQGKYRTYSGDEIGEHYGHVKKQLVEWLKK